jgi:hypothetical protein
MGAEKVHTRIAGGVPEKRGGAAAPVQSRHGGNVIVPIPEEWVHDAWIALLIATQARVLLLPEQLISYRIHSAQQIGVKRATPSDDLLVRRWTALAERLATFSLDPTIDRVLHKKLNFLKTRRALKQQHLPHRVVAASRTLPGYFSFARGLFSYLRDVAGVNP